jgi:hypothetical protein
MHASLSATPAREAARSSGAAAACACSARTHERAEHTSGTHGAAGFDLSRVPVSSLAAPPSIQRKPTISTPGDAFEQEADAVADTVMRMADAPAATQHSLPSIQRKCAQCEDEDKRHIHTHRDGAAPADASLDTNSAARATERSGAPLAPELRSYFEPRFGRDFSHVRVHTDAVAATAARAVHARAYTLGRDIVFGSGAYAPSSHAGRHLIAHELTHVVQQGRGARQVQRVLNVDEKASDDPKTAASTIDGLIKQLSPDYEVAKGGAVLPKKGTDCAGFKFAKIAKSKKPVGNCCLCTMTAAPTKWRIIVTTKDAPETDSAAHIVRMTPPAGVGSPDLRYWTGGPKETVKPQPAAEAFGHELCGHAALMQIGAHPSSKIATPDRAFSDIHDPTVRIQDALGKEMGNPGDRGLAGGGTHRGESLRVFAIGPFAADTDDPKPFAAQIKGAVDFLDGNKDLFVDAVGFRDGTDKKASVSATRASKVQAEVAKGIAVANASVQTTPKGPAESLTRVQPAVDGGGGATRTVELRMAIKPAGLLTPIGKAPPAKPVHVDPESPANVALLKSGKVPNECHKLLADQAWP